MAKQSLNRFYVLAFVDEEGREAVAEVWSPNRRPGSSRMPTLIAAGRILSAAIMLALRGVLPFIFVEGKSGRPASHRAYKHRPGNSVPLSVPLQLRLTRISA
jgi:hypothetical protein